MTSPLDVYGEDLLTAVGGTSRATWLTYEDGRQVQLDLPRWTRPADAADSSLLARCSGPTLDLGCGPGRLTRALAEQGVECLGVDVAPVAVALARSGGTPVLHASAFDEVLDDTRWACVLLADGNIGIGGDPARLLRRCLELLLPDGRVLVEVEGPEVATRSVRVQIRSGGGRASSWFPWAHVGCRSAAEVAGAAGLQVRDSWTAGGRWFVELEPA